MLQNRSHLVFGYCDHFPEGWQNGISVMPSPIYVSPHYLGAILGTERNIQNN
jgi:hypothetical protein